MGPKLQFHILPSFEIILGNVRSFRRCLLDFEDIIELSIAVYYHKMRVSMPDHHNKQVIKKIIFVVFSPAKSIFLMFVDIRFGSFWSDPVNIPLFHPRF